MGWPASPRHSSEANVPSTPDQRAHKTPKPKTGCGIDTVCRFHTPDSLDAIEVFEQILDRDGLDIVLLELDGEVLGATYLNVIPNLSRGGRPYAVIENVVIAAHRRGEKLGQIRCRQGLPTCCRI